MDVTAKAFFIASLFCLSCGFRLGEMVKSGGMEKITRTEERKCGESKGSKRKKKIRMG